MNYEIIADSSCNLHSDYIKDENIGFKIAPLKITVQDKTFVDDDNIDVDEMLKEVNASKKAGRTSCPSPYDYAQYYDEADYVVVITISSKLSGSYNSALAAIESSKNKNVIIIDSKAVAGTMVLLVDKVYALLKEDKLSFKELETTLNEYRDSINLYFVLDKFDNLVKNGRMNRIIALIAETLLVKPLCYAYDGQIKILEKVRTSKGAYKRLVGHIQKDISDASNRVCIITHVKAPDLAEEVRQMIVNNYNFKEVRIMEAKGLTSFYALEKGIMVSF
jgi:DegV family protein with EDD domain